MIDTIERHFAVDLLDVINDKIKSGEPFPYEYAKRFIEKLPSAQPDNQVHLCDSCSYTYPDCPSVYTDVIFGNGTGNDNICACSKYLPSAQTEIIFCKDCKKHNKHYHESPYKDTVCPLTAWRGKARGHEYDYQYCCYAERTDK